MTPVNPSLWHGDHKMCGGALQRLRLKLARNEGSEKIFHLDSVLDQVPIGGSFEETISKCGVRGLEGEPAQCRYRAYADSKVEPGWCR